jgi:hypothetical protein
MAVGREYKIQKYHADNGIFALTKFKQHCDNNKIVYSFSGVGAKHQNGVAERNIKTVAQYARANMLHMQHTGHNRLILVFGHKQWIMQFGFLIGCQT